MRLMRTPVDLCILILAAYCLMISGCVESENAIDPESLKTWEYYTTSNGLGSDSIWTMAEDREGNIWVGTMNNGVCKFDGEKWTIYNEDNGLLNNAVLCIAQDGHGFMWIGTQGGLSILANNAWTNMPELGVIQAILKDNDDNMWISSDNYYVLEYRNNTWYQYYDYQCEWCNYVNVLFEDSDGNMWLGSEVALKKLDNQNMTYYTQDDGLPGGAVRTIHQDIWGNIWIGTSRCGDVARLSNGKLEQVSLSNFLTVNFITSAASDNYGNVWFGLLAKGAVKYNGSYMEPWTIKDGLPGASVMKILCDRNGYLWFCTMDSGIARYLPDPD